MGSRLREWLASRRARRWEIDDELKFHLDMRTRELVGEGFSPRAARRAALRRFGDWRRVRRETYAVNGLPDPRKGDGMLETLWRDVRLAVRTLARTPGFALVVVLTFALGIGANTAVFSLWDSVVLRALPVREPERLVTAWVQFDGGLDSSFNYPLYTDYRDQNTVFEGLVAYSPTAFSMATDDRSERVVGMIVSGNFFDVLGVQPAPGRGFLPEEDAVPGAHPVAVIGHGLWERLGGGDDVIGSRLVLNGTPFTVVGVAPPGFTGIMRGFDAAVYAPMMMYDAVEPGREESPLVLRTRTWLQMLGRLKPGVSREQAQASMRALAGRIATTEPTNTDEAIVLADGSRGFTGFVDELATPLLLLQSVVALVLVVACANVAGLLLGRGLRRGREFAIRLALGSGRRRLARQLVTESLLLALAGGVVGIALAPWTTQLLLALQPSIASNVEVLLDRRVLAVSVALTLLTGLASGLAPAWQATRGSLAGSMKEQSGELPRGTGRSRLRSCLVVSQLALSLSVMVAAGLCAKSLARLHGIAPGFDSTRVLALTLDVGRSGYAEPRGRQLYAELLERVRSTAGVERASLAQVVPLTGSGMRITSTPEGYVPDPERPLNITFNVATPDLFATLGIRLVQGRDFTAEDRADGQQVVIVNEALVKQHWPSGPALGRYIDLGSGDGHDRVQVVGVVADSKYRELTEAMIPTMYLPLEQHYGSRVSMLVRTAAAPGTLAAPLRELVRSIDPMLPVFGVRSLDEQRRTSLASPRMSAVLMGSFGMLALLLTVLGLYGVLAYGVTQRTREIGVRIALGAESRWVLRMVLREGLALVLVGIGVGSLGALALSRLVRGLLYETSPHDPTTYLAMPLVLLAAATVACLVPARRATRIDPLVALRHD